MCECRKNRLGVTLVELMVAVGIMVAIFALATYAVGIYFTLMQNQSAASVADQQGLKILDETNKLLSNAILPIAVDSEIDEEGTARYWEDIDNKRVGFKGTKADGSSGERWRELLTEGTDGVLFVLPLDVLDGGIYDNNNLNSAIVSDPGPSSHIVLGQMRGDICYMGASINKWTHNSQTVFSYRDQFSDEPVSILRKIDPDKFLDAAFELIELPNATNWRDLTFDNTWPNATSFMAMRFVPVLDAYNNPVVVNEATGFKGQPVDFDGDSLEDGTFEIGRLQLIYSGGTNIPRSNDSLTDIVTETALDQMVISVTPNIVLRRIGAGKVPIFQLVDPDPTSSLDSSKAKRRRIGSLLKVRLLLVDNLGVDDAGGLIAGPYTKTPIPRWFESSIYLKNMRR